jgi:mannose-6-phosphate isomerase class I
MDYIKKNQSEIFNVGDLIAREYPTKNPNISCAQVELKGRHPKEGWISNEACTELVYFIRGSAILTTEKESVQFNEGDVVILSPKEKYYWVGDCTLLAPTTPPWTSQQTKNTK